MIPSHAPLPPSPPLPSPSLPSPSLPGGNVKCVLEVLEVLDNQLYTRSAAVSPITALMRRLRTIMANPQVGMTGGWASVAGRGTACLWYSDY